MGMRHFGMGMRPFGMGMRHFWDGNESLEWECDFLDGNETVQNGNEILELECEALTVLSEPEEKVGILKIMLVYDMVNIIRIH